MNTLINIVSEAHHEEIELIFPVWVFAAIAVVFFALLGFIVFAYRDVFNRHNDEVIPEHKALKSGDIDGHTTAISE